MFYLVTHLIRDERDFREMYLTMVIIATVLALHGIWQFIIGVPIPASWTDAAEGAVRTRVYSIFSNPNIMGAYMILFAPMTIGLAYACERPSQKVLFWLCGLAMCAGCLFTMSRGAWLALAAAAVLFALLIDRRLLALIDVYKRQPFLTVTTESAELDHVTLRSLSVHGLACAVSVAFSLTRRDSVLSDRETAMASVLGAKWEASSVRPALT